MLRQHQEAPMSDPNTTSSQSPDPAASGYSGNWRDQRRAERHARRAAWRNGGHPGWGGLPMGGFIVLVIGVVLLAGNLGYSVPHNWWAILILIPAVAALVNAIRFYRAEGQSPRVIGSAIGGLVMLALALALFFDIGLGLFWPVIIIVVGAAIVARSMWR
jgi:phosphatidylserine synthase